MWEETLLLVTADHGESLFDDDFLGHGHVINRQQTQVPLVLSRPGVAIGQPVGLADYRSLVLRALGARVPERVGPVFQYVGRARRSGGDRPGRQGGVSTTFELETEEVRFGETGRRARYSDLEPGSADKARADAAGRGMDPPAMAGALNRAPTGDFRQTAVRPYS